MHPTSSAADRTSQQPSPLARAVADIEAIQAVAEFDIPVTNDIGHDLAQIEKWVADAFKAVRQLRDAESNGTAERVSRLALQQKGQEAAATLILNLESYYGSALWEWAGSELEQRFSNLLYRSWQGLCKDTDASRMSLVAEDIDQLWGRVCEHWDELEAARLSTSSTSLGGLTSELLLQEVDCHFHQIPEQIGSVRRQSQELAECVGSCGSRREAMDLLAKTCISGADLDQIQEWLGTRELALSRFQGASADWLKKQAQVNRDELQRGVREQTELMQKCLSLDGLQTTQTKRRLNHLSTRLAYFILDIHRLIVQLAREDYGNSNCSSQLDLGKLGDQLDAFTRLDSRLRRLLQVVTEHPEDELSLKEPIGICRAKMVEADGFFRNPKKYLSEHHYHPLCSNRRARVLLSECKPGSYLITSNPENRIVIHYVDRGGHIRIGTPTVFSNGKVLLPDNSSRVSLIEYLRTIMDMWQVTRIANRYMSPLVAACEWTSLPPKLTAPKLRKEGQCYLVRHDQGYDIHYCDRSGETKIRHAAIRKGQLQCDDRSYDSLYALLQEIHPQYQLSHTMQDRQIQELCFRVLLPALHQRNTDWMATAHPTRPSCTVWVNRAQQIFQTRTNVLGRGGFKEVRQLQSIGGSHSSHARVAALFHERTRSSSTVKQSSAVIAALRKDLGNDPRFLLAEPAEFWDGTAFHPAQVMDEMAGDLGDCWDKLNWIGRLRALQQAAEILDFLGERGWCYADAKQTNFMVCGPVDPNHPQLRLGDFDCAQKMTVDGVVIAGTREFKDPVVTRRKCQGLEAARIADQFSFAAMAVRLLTGHSIRRSVVQTHLGHEIQPKQLTEIKGWHRVHPVIRALLPNLLVGINRRYQLKEVVETLGHLIVAEECKLLLAELE